ncbi:MAG: hypothetical protein RL757_2991 [Bacteroidota bacterium]|jgi:hypothetical protein
MKKGNKTVQKSDLPKKICPVCSLEFAWRKKWERNWEDVKYCSDKCRGASKKNNLDKEK